MATNYWETQRPQQTSASVAGLPGFSAAGVAGTAVRQPTGEELVENRLTKLLAGDSSYIQGARTRGMKQAASRGLLNSSLAGAASEAAAGQAALPVVSQDAAAFSSANAQNQQGLNAATLMKYQSDLANQNNMGQSRESVQISYDSTPAEREDRAWRAEQAALDREFGREGMTAEQREREAERGFNREMTLGDRDFRRQEGETDRAYGERIARMGQDFQRGMAGDERAYGLDVLGRTQGFQSGQNALDRNQRQSEMYQTMFGALYGRALDTVMSSPDYWGNPEAAFGFMQAWGGQFQSFMSRYGISPGGGNNTGGP